MVLCDNLNDASGNLLRDLTATSYSVRPPSFAPITLSQVHCDQLRVYPLSTWPKGINRSAGICWGCFIQRTNGNALHRCGLCDCLSTCGLRNVTSINLRWWFRKIGYFGQARTNLVSFSVFNPVAARFVHLYGRYTCCSSFNNGIVTQVSSSVVMRGLSTAV